MKSVPEQKISLIKETADADIVFFYEIKITVLYGSDSSW